MAATLRVRRVRVVGDRMIEKFPVLYSTQTYLAYWVAQNYYNGEHYVWCTPIFDPSSPYRDRDSIVPPSSSPYEVYRSLAKAVADSDLHSEKIEDNRTGILRGALEKKQSGVINDKQEQDIVGIVNKASTNLFDPLVYVIPYPPVADRVREPRIEDKAHPLSAEYIIDLLPRKFFDIIAFGVPK
jgi:hypothetical protein